MPGGELQLEPGHGLSPKGDFAVKPKARSPTHVILLLRSQLYVGEAEAFPQKCLSHAFLVFVMHELLGRQLHQLPLCTSLASCEAMMGDAFNVSMYALAPAYAKCAGMRHPFLN